MNIVITGSIGHIGRPLTRQLIRQGHSVTVITSKAERQKEIEELGAIAAVGTFQDVNFLIHTFRGADIVYLMETWEGIGSIFNKEMNFVAGFNNIANNYKNAVESAGIKKIVHLSSIGAHTNKEVGSLYVHNNVENILKQLPDEVAIKFVRPPSFFTNVFRLLPAIKAKGAIYNTYGGDKKEPWVSPLDIALFIADEMEKPFNGKKAYYVASEDLSPNDITKIIGEAIGQPDLRWIIIPEKQMLNQMLDAGVNEFIANGLIAMQAAQGNGSLYEDFNLNRPNYGIRRLKELAEEIARAYHQL